MAASIASRTVSEGSDENEAEVLQELGLLEAIYINELNVVHSESGAPCELSIVLHPATAGNVDQQYVCLTLHLRLPERYPNTLPEITIRNSRGISDEHLTSLDVRLKELATERQGQAMLYELIEVAKESLTNNNTPSCQCVICLHGFTEADVFSKTQCYHYFHSQCLARYIRHAQENEEESVCPVCREPVTFDLPQLDQAPPPCAAQTVYKPNKVIRDMQVAMAALYRRQKEKGGIIDIEAESNKYLINISQTPNLPRNTGISPATSLSQSLKTTDTLAESADGTTSPRKEWRPVRESGDKDTDSSKEKQDRVPPRSESKGGGRDWGKGRGSRGRNHPHHQHHPHRRPQSSGVGGHDRPAPGPNGRHDEARGQRGSEGPSSHRDSEKPANRSRPRTYNTTSQSREDRARETEVKLDNGSKDGLRPESKTGPRDRPKSRSQRNPDRDTKEASQKPTANVDGVSKSEEPKHFKRTAETAGKDLDRAVPDVASARDQAGRRRTAQGDRGVNRGKSDSRPDDGRTSSGQRDFHKSSPPGAALRNSEPGSGKRSDPRRPVVVATDSQGGGPVSTDAARSSTAAQHEGGRQRQRHRNRRRGGEPGQSQDGEAREARGQKAGTDGDQGARKPSERLPQHRRPRPDQRAPPPQGFGPAVTDKESSGAFKPVRPPPGFEKLVL